MTLKMQVMLQIEGTILHLGYGSYLIETLQPERARKNSQRLKRSFSPFSLEGEGISTTNLLQTR